MHEEPTRYMGDPGPRGRPPAPSGGGGMSPLSRALIAILVVAVIGLAIGLVVATGGSDEDATTAATTTTQTTTATTTTQTTTATTTTTATGTTTATDESGGTPSP